MRYFVTIEDREHAIDVHELPGGSYDVRVLPPDAPADAAGTPLEADVIGEGKELAVRIDGRVLDLVVDGKMPSLEVFASGHRATVKVETARMRAAASVRDAAGGSSDGVVTSPMPGKVVKVLVSEGDEVAQGAPLAVVEAMKMENELVAPTAGVVKKVFVQTGDAVEGGAQLVAVG